MWKLEIYDVKETWTHDTHSGGIENFAAWRRNESRVWESCSRCAVRIMSANMSRKSTWGERKSWGRATSWEPTCSRHEIDFSSIKTKRRDLTKEIKFQSGRNSDQSYCRSRFFFIAPFHLDGFLCFHVPDASSSKLETGAFITFRVLCKVLRSSHKSYHSPCCFDKFIKIPSVELSMLRFQLRFYFHCRTCCGWCLIARIPTL